MGLHGDKDAVDRVARLKGIDREEAEARIEAFFVARMPHESLRSMGFDPEAERRGKAYLERAENTLTAHDVIG